MNAWWVLVAWATWSPGVPSNAVVMPMPPDHNDESSCRVVQSSYVAKHPSGFSACITVPK